MIKIRLQGTKENMKWFEKKLIDLHDIQIMESSDVYENKGTSKYFRKYLEVEPAEKK